MRRLHLDRLLEEAAVRAGAVLRDETKVLALVRENDRVAGVEAVHDGVRQTYRARMVVGADGRHSTVAELAGVKEYLGYDNTRFAYWAYWPAKPAWTHPGLRSFDAYTGFAEDGNVRFIFQTDSDLLLIGVTPPMAQLPSWKGRHEEAYLEAMRSSRVTAPLIENNERVGKLYGILSGRFFFREAVGPGFALVGDSGLHKDPTPGFGITDALRDSKNLAHAILAGTEGALVRYWRQRDVDSIDLFHFAADMADPGYLNPFNRLVFEHFRESPELLARLGAQLDRQLSPFDVVSTPTVMRWVMGATLRGNLSVVPSFVRAAKRNAHVHRARRERRALLDAALRT